MESNSPSIEWEISPQGVLTYKVKGVKGASCKSLTAGLDELGEVASSELTAEYHQSPTDPLLAATKTQVKQTEVI